MHNNGIVLLKRPLLFFFNNSENRMILNLIHLHKMSLLFKWMKQPNKSDLQKSHASLIRLLLTTAINQALKSALSTLFIFSFTCLVLQLKKCVPRVKNRFYLTIQNIARNVTITSKLMKLTYKQTKPTAHTERIHLLL